MENGEAVHAGVQLKSQQLETIWLDLHYAVRTFMKRPAFSLTIIFIFALGTGANTAIFSLVYSTLIRPLPYSQPDRLVRLWEVEDSSPQTFQMTSVSNLKDWRQRNRTLEAIAAWKRPASTTLTAQIPAEEIRAASVTANFFSLLKTNIAFGRAFQEEDELIQSNVAVVSHGFWKRNLGGRADAVGSRLELDQENYTIVGILPADFNSPGAKADVWVPMSLEVNSIDRGQNYLQIIARMKHGVSVQQARADLDALASALEKEYPASNRRHGIALIPMQQQLTSAIRTPLIILFVTVSLVLLIACLNISNLLVVRGFDRRREFTIRMALGGSRARVMRQLLTENVLLFLAGGVAGIVLSRWILRALLLLEPQLHSDLYRTSIDAGTFAFSIAFSLLTGLVFGSLPAIQFRRKELGMNLKVREPGSAGDRFTAILRGCFVVLQIAASLALMISAGLLVQSFVSMRRVPAGFNRDHLLIAHQAIDGVKYSDSTSNSRYYRNLTAKLRQIPGVRNAAASTVIPMGDFGIDFQVPYSREDRALQEIAVSPQAYFRAVTPEYFTTLQIPILQGRSFMENEDGSAPLAVIVNEALARKTWPGENPVGKKLRFFWADWQTYNVIGLVANTVSYGISAGEVPELFVSDAQIPYSVMNVVVRFDLLSAGSADQVRKVFLEIDPLQPVQDITTMKSLTDRSLGRERFVAFLVSAFGLLAMLLASTGIYGTISFAVVRRTREIGLRMALGATRFQIRNWVLKQGAALILPGILLGMAGALGAASLLQKFLFGIQAVDSVTFALSAAALCFMAMMACFFPANRAAALDPNRALHYE